MAAQSLAAPGRLADLRKRGMRFSYRKEVSRGLGLGEELKLRPQKARPLLGLPSQWCSCPGEKQRPTQHPAARGHKGTSPWRARAEGREASLRIYNHRPAAYSLAPRCTPLHDLGAPSSRLNLKLSHRAGTSRCLSEPRTNTFWKSK